MAGGLGQGITDKYAVERYREDIFVHDKKNWEIYKIDIYVPIAGIIQGTVTEKIENTNS